MSELIAIIGPPGSGKSTSIRTLDPQETFIIKVANKPLPIKGHKKKYFDQKVNKETFNMHTADDPEEIKKYLKYISSKRPEIKQIILDDSNYVMAFSNMRKVNETGFKKFIDMAKEFYDIVMAAASLRDDLKVFFFAHDENVGDALDPKRKFKTVGKLLDNAINIEGLFTYVLFTDVQREDDSETSTYSFVTNNDGTTTAKTPMECFDTLKIPNDLQFVVDKMNEYNEG